MASSHFAYVDTPQKEQEVIKQFSQLQQLLRNRNREERLKELNISEKNTKFFSPLIQATQESTDRITERLDAQQQMRPKQKAQKQSFSDQGSSTPISDDVKPLLADDEDEKKYFKMFFDIPTSQVYPKSEDLDKNFGIIKVRDQYKFAGKSINITNDGNLQIAGDDQILRISSPGVWNLIMLANPQSSMYDDEDLLQYREILKKVGMIEFIDTLPTSKKDKFEQMIKWKELVQPLLGIHIEPRTPFSPAKTRSATMSKEKPQSGRGIMYSRIIPAKKGKYSKKAHIIKTFGDGITFTQNKKRINSMHKGIAFLPSDIQSLQHQLVYLLGEYQSGNLALRNKIVAILKNLKERNAITPSEYGLQMNSINQ